MRYSLNNSVNEYTLDTDMREYYTPSHTDIPRLREGRLGAQVRAASNISLFLTRLTYPYQNYEYITSNTYTFR